MDASDLTVWAIAAFFAVFFIVGFFRDSAPKTPVVRPFRILRGHEQAVFIDPEGETLYVTDLAPGWQSRYLLIDSVYGMYHLFYGPQHRSRYRDIHEVRRLLLDSRFGHAVYLHHSRETMRRTPPRSSQPNDIWRVGDVYAYRAAERAKEPEPPVALQTPASINSDKPQARPRIVRATTKVIRIPKHKEPRK